jgi:G3E family GTPase
MLQNIPTHVIGGPLGAGKTSLIRHLLANKPERERWAVLINEFGLVGLDAALLTNSADGIALGEVAGGCLCCVTGVPFQVGLGRLLRKARPDRLLIEPSGLGHPAQLMSQLRMPPWLGVLAVQPAVIVLDAAALIRGETLPPSQQDAIAQAGLLVMNKSENLSESERSTVAERFADHTLIWTRHGRTPITRLPGFSQQRAVDNLPGDNLVLPESAGPLPVVWTRPEEPVCVSQSAEAGWSIGWRWHPSQRFDLQRLRHWLRDETWLRAKLVIQGETGWVSSNAVEGGDMDWRSSDWRQDSRLELIFATPQDSAALKARFNACRL